MQRQGLEGTWLILFEKAYFIFPVLVIQARGGLAQKPKCLSF